MRSLKQILQDNMLKKADAEYEQNLNRKKNTYRELLTRLDPENCAGMTGDAETEGPTDSTVRSAASAEMVSRPVWQTVTEDFQSAGGVHCVAGFTVFASKQGVLYQNALDAYGKSLEEDDVMIVYGDEDVLLEGERSNPWFKPAYSPDLLLSFPYMGNGIAIRESLLQSVMQEMHFTGDGAVNLYDLLLRAVEQLKPEQIRHVERVTYTSFAAKEHVPGSEERFLPPRLAAMERRGYPCRTIKDRFGVIQLVMQVPPQTEEKPLISVIIPSRDHPELIRACIGSIYEKNRDASFEIIVIDNGSVGANRARIANLRNELSFRYYYEPGEFHFARICNLAAERAEGQYLLFLNDDTRMISEHALMTMCGQASMEHVGCVGAKLLYEDGKTIQHAGIVNTQVGPVHILMGEADDRNHYHGRNILPYDCLAVTGACFMIRADRFRALGGFDEDFRVSYNDVDLGFRLWEQGYCNVIRNDVEVIHYESVSRGTDAEDERKWERLFGERRILFEKHSALYRYDPYFSRYLDPDVPGFRVKVPDEAGAEWQACPKLPQLLAKYTNEALRVQIDRAGVDERTDLMGTNGECMIVGWWYVVGQDNARYRMKLLLLRERGDGHYCRVIEGVVREDVAAVLLNEKNVSLGGFSVRIPVGTLPAGTYRIGLMAADRCSRQQLVRMTDRCVVLR